MSQSQKLIDVKRLMRESSIEELNELAENYFAQVTDWNFHLAKPFGSIDEAPQLLINLAVVLQGLRLCRGMTVLEFGAGSCWAARFLSQLGCRVIAVDVSATALKMGQELYARHAPFGNTLPAEFRLFDGYRLPVPDESVERIICLHALHHVPNPATIISEFGRVLKEGGIAGFAEPGPQHSTSTQSQDEMRTFGVIENDVRIEEIWRDANAAGFTDLKLALFNVPPFLLSVDEFENFQRGGKIERKYSEATRAYLKNQRTFFLYKGEPQGADSRFPDDLSAVIRIKSSKLVVEEGKNIELAAHVKNDSSSIWLPRNAGVGAVLLGCHVLDRNGKSLYRSYHWEALTPGDGIPIGPGEKIDVNVIMPPLPIGEYVLEFDMVSNDVCWFAQNHSPTVRVDLEVVSRSVN
jgi:ubiquinone/menaquinone biosynthesis C-methylase UbiE